MDGKIYYSPSTKGFYHEGVHHTVPDDSRQVTEDQYKEFHQNSAKGLVAEFDGIQFTFSLPLNNFDSSSAERIWRDAELRMADIEINKIQDGSSKSSLKQWRAYRNALRSWPEHEKYPNSDYRPSSPSQIKGVK